MEGAETTAHAKVLLIWDVFKGQKTDKVLSKLASLNMEVVSVPANKTHFFQPLDVTVNKGKTLHERPVHYVVFSRNTKANGSKRE